MRKNSAKLIFICPKCSKELVMIPTEKNNWHMLNRNHNKSIIIDSKTGKENVNTENCMDFSFGTNKIPIIFINIDNKLSKKENLDIALRELKNGNFGIDINIKLKKNLAGAYLWKLGNKYFGKVGGIITPDSLASTYFDDAEKFAYKWFNWSKNL